MGDKVAARKAAIEAGVPIGTTFYTNIDNLSVICHYLTLIILIDKKLILFFGNSSRNRCPSHKSIRSR